MLHTSEVSTVLGTVYRAVLTRDGNHGHGQRIGCREVVLRQEHKVFASVSSCISHREHYVEVDSVRGK